MGRGWISASYVETAILSKEWATPPTVDGLNVYIASTSA